VFKRGGTVIDKHVAPEDLTDPLLSALSPTSITAVPLRIEARPVGVLLVADKNAGEFSVDDAAALEALAGPAALVLNQMARYEEAKVSGAKMAELAQLKTDFVSVVSHELRTPLTSIIGSLITLQRPELQPADPNARELIASAAKQANRLKTLIEDLLVVSRLETKTFPVRLQQLQPSLFFPEVLASIPNGSERVRLLIEEGIEPINADPDHLSRIITNLVDNAMKYAGDSAIELQAKQAGTAVHVSVIDHGPGIPYDLRDHVFDRFTQLQPAQTRAEGGTGLGLSIVKGLADSLGARVWFEPTIGGGATFTLALPSEPARAVAAG
jgi:signal transduction histidine kinase